MAHEYTLTYDHLVGNSTLIKIYSRDLHSPMAFGLLCGGYTGSFAMSPGNENMSQEIKGILKTRYPNLNWSLAQ